MKTKIGPVRKFIARALSIPVVRSLPYTGSIVSRLTEDWITSNQTANTEIWQSLEKLRSRSRDLSRNNRYIVKYLSSQEQNIIGDEGFTLQMRIRRNNGTPDKSANDAIETPFWEWGKEATACGMTWHQAKCMALRSTIVDGEILLRKRIMAGQPRLEFIEADRLDYNFTGRNGDNRIVMGVEVNQYGRPVAYHILNYLPTDFLGAQSAPDRRRERVPADQIIHVFEKTRPGQLRGTPWIAPVMKALHHIEGYEDAEVIAARIAASKMGFFSSKEGAEYEGEMGADGAKIMEAAPGQFEHIGNNDFQTFDPGSPNSNYPDFVKAQLRGISAGLKEPYNLLASDLEGVNYSSLRGGLLDARETYKMRQKWFVSAFINPVFSWWLEYSLLAGNIRLENGSPLPFRKLDRFNAPEWRGRRWSWVDPLKDIQAVEKALTLKLTSHKEVLADQGKWIEETFEDINLSEKAAEHYGIDLTITPKGFPPPASAENDDEEADDDDESVEEDDD